MNQITTEVVNRLIWVEVLDSDGRIGWIPATYLTIITPTSTKTLTVTLTSTGIPTNTTFVSPDNGSNFEGAEYLEATSNKISPPYPWLEVKEYGLRLYSKCASSYAIGVCKGPNFSTI